MSSASGIVLRVDRMDEQDPEILMRGQPRGGEAIEQPAKLIRIAAMIRELLEEVRQSSVDEAGRKRLRQIVGDLRAPPARDVENDDIDEPADRVEQRQRRARDRRQQEFQPGVRWT